jgi:hypothetical protein
LPDHEQKIISPEFLKLSVKCSCLPKKTGIPPLTGIKTAHIPAAWNQRLTTKLPAPTARHPSAQGNALGIRAKESCGL